MSWWNDTPDFDFWESIDWINITIEEETDDVATE